jgi:hypothetical protein
MTHGKTLNVMNYNYIAENFQYQIIRTNFCEKHFNNFFLDFATSRRCELCHLDGVRGATHARKSGSGLALASIGKHAK